jgi:hypothetical protein
MMSDSSANLVPANLVPGNLANQSTAQLELVPVTAPVICTAPVTTALVTSTAPGPSAMPDSIGAIDESVRPSALPATGTRSAALEVLRGPQAGRRFELASDGVTTVGRHPDNTIVLSSVTVSRRHAEIRRENGRLVVVDLGSLNGTYLNQRPVDAAVLAEGDELAIGGFRLVFHA